MKLKLLTLLLLTAIFAVFIAPVSAQDATVPDVLTLPDQIAEGRPVTITVSNMPPADQADARAAWEAQAARFTDLYPNVTVQGLELEYNPAAYVALAAGGQLPTLFMTYFTEPSKFIPQGVVADLTPYIEAAGVTDVFNASVLDITSADSAIYGIPLNAYALGLAYNKTMLADAGYDAPPATWDELAEMAVALTDADAGRAGFAFINDGGGATGWHYTNIAYGFGATPDELIVVAEDGTVSAGYGSSEGAVAALDYIHDLRWEKNVLPGATLDWGAISEALVSERVAMTVYAGDQFNYVYFNFPDADLGNFGFAPMPAGPNGSVSLIGGNLHMVAASATADQQEAAAYLQLWRQFDPAEVTAGLEATTEAVGMPTLPMYTGDYQAAWEAFREPYNKLPVENYAAFNDAIEAGEIVFQVEPAAAVQDYYAEVAIVVSEVLSIDSVDTAARLTQSADEFQSFVLDQLQ